MHVYELSQTCRFVPPVSAESGEMEMESNICYLTFAGIGSLPPVESMEDICDGLPYEEPTAKKHECGEVKDHDYVNDPQGEAYKQAIDEAVVRDDDGYYVNDDLFPEEYRVSYLSSMSKYKHELEHAHQPVNE